MHTYKVAQHLPRISLPTGLGKMRSWIVKTLWPIEIAGVVRRSLKTFLIFDFYLCRPRCRRYTFISNNDISTQATSDRSIHLLQQVAREVPSKQAKSEAINAEEQRHEKRHIFLSCHCSISRGVLSLDSVHTFSSQNGGAADRNLASKNFRLHWNGGG